MATLTITLNTGTGTLTDTVTISANDLTTLETTFTQILNTQGNASPSNQDIFDYWVSRWKADTITIVRAQQQQVAAAGVTSIVLT